MDYFECWAEIPDNKERQSIMKWVRAEKFESFAEIGDEVHVVYKSNPNDPNDSGRRWAIIHSFEQYPKHGIVGKSKKKG